MLRKKKKRPVGRPSKFSSLNLQDIKKYVISGLTDEQLRIVLHISESSLNRFKHSCPEFWESLREWKQNADKRVERSLYERACGYSHPAVKFFQHGKKIIKQEYIEHHPPDATSMIFWLKNRQPEVWRDAQYLKGEGFENKTYIFNNLKELAENVAKARTDNPNKATDRISSGLEG